MIPAWAFTVVCVICLTAGTVFVMWLGERITEKGIGNGISLIIMIGIIAFLPQALLNEFPQIGGIGRSDTNIFIFLIEIAALFLVTAGVVYVTQGTRRIPVQYAKRVVGRKQMGGTTQYLPLRVNAAGVMPIIFAQSIMFIPSTIASFFQDSAFWTTVGTATGDIFGFWYSAIFFVICVFFTYFYTAIAVNPQEMADTMKRQGGFIPGVRPGRQTSEFIDTILTRITLPGALFIGAVAILPAFAAQFGVQQGFAQFFGGTSLLILVGVTLDTLQQVESHLLMRHYDGFMKTGRVRGPAPLDGDRPHLAEERRRTSRASARPPAWSSGRWPQRRLSSGRASRRWRWTGRPRRSSATPAGGRRSRATGWAATPSRSPARCASRSTMWWSTASRAPMSCARATWSRSTAAWSWAATSATSPTRSRSARSRRRRRISWIRRGRRCSKASSRASAGKRVGDIGWAIQTHCEERGYGVVRDLVGHGVGRRLHEPPNVPNLGRRGVGKKLKPGLTICIEPMINGGTGDVTVDADGWTVRTADGAPSAHFEHMVLVEKGSPVILSSYTLIEAALATARGETLAAPLASV